MRRSSWWVGALVLPTLVVAAQPAEKTVLTGKVIDPSGHLVPSARVLGTVDFYDPDNHAVAERFPETGLAVAGDGTFVVREGKLRPGVKTLRFRTIASADGYSTSDEVISVPIGEHGYAPAIVRLRRAIEHRVVVVDDVTQAPIPGASVTADCGAPQTAVPAGRDGVAQLHACDDRSQNPLMAEAPGYRIGGIAVDFATPTQTIALSKLRPLHLRVIDADTGVAIAGCDIAIETQKLRTDARGLVDALAAYGAVVVTPSCPGYGANLDTIYQVQFGPADASALHTQKLRHNFAVVGRVVDGKGRPIASATVEVRPINEISLARPMAVATTTSDHDGRFRFDSFSADRFVLSAWTATTVATQEIVFKDQKGSIVLVAKPR